MMPQIQRCSAFRELPLLARINAFGIATALAAFAVVLWPAWRHDDNLAHGIFLPLLSAILVAESRRDPGPRFLGDGAGPLALCSALVLAALGSFAIAIIYAAAVGWSHAMAEFMLATAVVFALGAAWIGFADSRVRFVPLNWAAAVAVGLWLFAAPMPPGTYARVALFLQAEVTNGVVHVLNALGIAAYQDGNVIQLARTSVGVSEACSGVRSLVSCAAAGLFLSALLVRTPAHRVLVIAVSPLIGLAMNFVRSLLLTLLVNSGVSIEGRWHDLTGMSILVATTALVAGFAFWLRRTEAPAAPGPARTPPAQDGRSPLPGVVAAGLALGLGAAGILAASSGDSRPRSAKGPDLAALLPPPPPGWSAVTTPDLDQYSGVLQTHDLVERVYSAGSSPQGVRLTFYLAYWRPGQASVSLVDAHTPDACWPGTGWELEAPANERAALESGGWPLAPAECRIFSRDGRETRVWFWHLYGGRPLTFVDPYSAPRLLGLALRYGFGRPEDQLFIRVSSNRPWREIASEPVLRHFLENLKPLGL